MQELALTRRAALTMGLGAATATVAGCGSLGDIRRHGVSTPAPSPTPSVAPQWVASDALSPALVEAIDLAAMNEAAGIWLGPATKDQYGPYRPLRLPTGHKLLHAKPTDPDKDALATRPMRDWRYQLSIIAPLFVREVLDPPELWVHNRKRQAAWTNRMWEVLSPGGKKDPSGYFGQESFMNSDGKLAQRVGGLPAKRTTAKARLGVEDLWWTVLPDADGMAWIQLQANTTSLVTVGSAPYTWTRTSRLAVAFTSKSTWMSPTGDDACSTAMPNALTKLPQLQLATPREDWEPHTMKNFTFSTPRGFTKSKPGDRFDLHFDGHGKAIIDVSTRVGGPVDRSWNLVPGFQNTRISLPGGVGVLAEWGHDPDLNRFMCRAWVYGRQLTAEVRFSTTPATAAEDLRHHASTWRLTE